MGKARHVWICCRWRDYYIEALRDVRRPSKAVSTLHISVLQVDKEIPGASWIEIPRGTYSLRPDNKKRSRCQLELDVIFNHMKSHPCDGEWNKVAPLRILSFDIECAGRKGHFPEVRQPFSAMNTPYVFLQEIFSRSLFRQERSNRYRS